jgi:hypothetical protein
MGKGRAGFLYNIRIIKTDFNMIRDIGIGLALIDYSGTFDLGGFCVGFIFDGHDTFNLLLGGPFGARAVRGDMV